MKKNSKKKAKSSEFSYENLFLLFAVIVFIDRIAKIFLNDGCISSLCIKKVVNYGAAFGIMQGMTWIFIAVAIAVLIIIFLFINDMSKAGKIAFAFIGAGTAANLIDRIFFSHVIDIFSIFGSSSFNLADISNCIGGILLIISLFKKKN